MRLLLPFPPHYTNAPSTGRCHELQSPALAVKVFGDFGRYGVPLTLEGGRTLLHSLLLYDSIPNIVAVTTLYKVYDLPPLASDLVSCSILVAACHKHGDADAQVVAETLTPFLKDLVAKGGEAGRGKHPEEQYEKWLSWALFQVHQARVKAEQPSYPWLEKLKQGCMRIVSSTAVRMRDRTAAAPGRS